MSLEGLKAAAINGDEMEARDILRSEDLTTPESQATLKAATRLAIAHGHTGILKLLAEAGVDPSAPMDTLSTPLQLAAHLITHSGEMTRTLFDLGARLDDCPNKLPHPLILAARRGNDEAGRHLLSAGADVNISHLNSLTQHEGTAVHAATEYNQPAFIQLLAEHGADLERRNTAGETPLLQAAAHGHTDCVAALLAAGADIGAKTEDGWDARQCALAENHREAVALLEYHQLRQPAVSGESAISEPAPRRRL